MTNKKITEDCARVLNIPLFADGDFVTGYVWIDETPSEYGFLKQHNEGNQSLYFAPLTRVADAISVASKLQMELSFLADRAVAKSSCGEYVKSFLYKSRVVPAYRNDAMCRAICVLAQELFAGGLIK